MHRIYNAKRALRRLFKGADPLTVQDRKEVSTLWDTVLERDKSRKAITSRLVSPRLHSFDMFGRKSAALDGEGRRNIDDADWIEGIYLDVC